MNLKNVDTSMQRARWQILAIGAGLTAAIAAIAAGRLLR
jgi:hypothetical protein